VNGNGVGLTLPAQPQQRHQGSITRPAAGSAATQPSFDPALPGSVPCQPHRTCCFIRMELSSALESGPIPLKAVRSRSCASHMSPVATFRECMSSPAGRCMAWQRGSVGAPQTYIPSL